MISVQGISWRDDELRDRIIYVAKRRTELMDRLVDGGKLTPEESEAAALRARELFDVLMPYVIERRSGEGSDFISMIWRDAETLFGSDYDEQDVLSMVCMGFFAGFSTTASAVGNALYMLLSDASPMSQLRKGGQPAVKNVVEETLRLYGPAEFVFRRAKRDVEIAGVQINQNDPVLMVTSASSRDERRYRCPADVDIARRAPGDHFGFYMGPRTCPGQALARYEMQRVLAVALERLPQDLELDPSKEPPSYSGKAVRRFAPLNVRFTP